MEDEVEELSVVEEEYKVWKKNTPFLYDLVISRALEWPSLTVQWLPTVQSSPSFSVHKLIMGTQTNEGAPNFLMLADAYLPLPGTAESEPSALPKVTHFFSLPFPVKFHFWDLFSCEFTF